MDLSLNNLKINNEHPCFQIDMDAVGKVNSTVEAKTQSCPPAPALGQETDWTEKPRTAQKTKAPKVMQGVSGMCGMSGFSGFIGMSGFSKYKEADQCFKRYGNGIEVVSRRPRPSQGQSICA